MAKPRIKIKEIKKNIKITEIKKEEVIEKKPQEEESLEELALDAPSARAFPQFNQPRIIPQEIEEPTAGKETASANQNQPTYAVRNVTEGELQRTYQTGTSADTSPIANIRNPVLAPRGRANREFQNQELQALRNQTNQDERDKYDISVELQHEKKRKMPWEL